MTEGDKLRDALDKAQIDSDIHRETLIKLVMYYNAHSKGMISTEIYLNQQKDLFDEFIFRIAELSGLGAKREGFDSQRDKVPSSD